MSDIPLEEPKGQPASEERGPAEHQSGLTSDNGAVPKLLRLETTASSVMGDVRYRPVFSKPGERIKISCLAQAAEGEQGQARERPAFQNTTPKL